MAQDGVVVDDMVVEPALQARLVAMVMAAGLPDTPWEICSSVGRVGLGDGHERGFFVRHAADAVLSDANGNLVLITRLHPPGKGKLAIPGGFLDLISGDCETVVAAARRELEEETGIAGNILNAAMLQKLGRRRYRRGFDLRVAWNDMPDAGLSKGDVFMVSTQPVYFRTAVNLTKVMLQPGDDAQAACVVNVAEIGALDWAVPDQLGMIEEMPG